MYLKYEYFIYIKKSFKLLINLTKDRIKNIGSFGRRRRFNDSRSPSGGRPASLFFLLGTVLGPSICTR